MISIQHMHDDLYSIWIIWVLYCNKTDRKKKKEYSLLMLALGERVRVREREQVRGGEEGRSWIFRAKLLQFMGEKERKCGGAVQACQVPGALDSLAFPQFFLGSFTNYQNSSFYNLFIPEY